MVNNAFEAMRLDEIVSLRKRLAQAEAKVILLNAQLALYKSTTETNQTLQRQLGKVRKDNQALKVYKNQNQKLINARYEIERLRAGLRSVVRYRYVVGSSDAVKRAEAHFRAVKQLRVMARALLGGDVVSDDGNFQEGIILRDTEIKRLRTVLRRFARKRLHHQEVQWIAQIALDMNTK